ncbi:MAG TPA: 2-hydroxyacyl-CoA dehydratase family protein [Pseudonocardia sp.]|jgi:bcr-type benzoyl-CoA reductase subunit C|uniref:2-hydroxyacyl-CoA dehydratase subunit D n=1 Tax=Pseudonocardia sp. TaxID=60912 RepID=UPI002F3E50E2
MPGVLQEALATLSEVADDPDAYVVEWKLRTEGRAVGVFPMHFPAEIVHAAGALPVLIQESREPDVHGRNLLAEFYCGYTRSLADSAARGHLDIYDGFFLADHCIQLLGAVDVVRAELPERPMFFGQLPTSLTDGWTLDKTRTVMQTFVDELGGFAGAALTEEALATSIELFNVNRRLLRELFAARRAGNAALTAGQLQVLVKSGMVMDRAEHTALLRQILAELPEVPRDDRIRVHLSGHLCHAPKAELLAAIEECGAVVVDDDLFTGSRYIATDVAEDGDPVEALAQRYLRNDVNAPNPTRVKHESDWEDHLVHAVEAAGAQGVIVLMVRFCEPHMLYYPELRRRLGQRGIPHLLIETEHEGLPVETVRTRVEAFLERIRRNSPVEVTA